MRSRKQTYDEDSSAFDGEILKLDTKAMIPYLRGSWT